MIPKAGQMDFKKWWTWWHYQSKTKLKMIRNDQHGPRNTISREGRRCQRESRIPGARRKDPLTSQGSLSLITSFFLPTLPFVCFPPTTFSQVTPVQGQRCSALMWQELYYYSVVVLHLNLNLNLHLHLQQSKNVTKQVWAEGFNSDISQPLSDDRSVKSL